MYTVDYETAKVNFETLIDMATSEQQTVEISTETDPVLLINKKEYNALIETAYLSSNPKTRQIIIDGLNTPLAECEVLNWETI